MRYGFLCLSVFALSLLLVSSPVVVSSCVAQDDASSSEGKAIESEDDGFQSLFDGESLNGWSGNEKFWSVEGGFITGRTTKENPTDANTFLIWKDGEVGDFELRLKYKITDGNSGIQYRSKEFEEFRVSGYQADIDSKNNYTGILYEEKGRGILCPRTKKIEIGEDGKKAGSDEATCDDKEFLESLKSDGWNEYIVIAKGNHIVQKINGFVTAEIIDNQSEKSAAAGILALQLHAGPPMKIQFKEIELKKLEKE